MLKTKGKIIFITMAAFIAVVFALLFSAKPGLALAQIGERGLNRQFL